MLIIIILYSLTSPVLPTCLPHFTHMPPPFYPHASPVLPTYSIKLPPFYPHGRFFSPILPTCATSIELFPPFYHHVYYVSPILPTCKKTERTDFPHFTHMVGFFPRFTHMPPPFYSHLKSTSRFTATIDVSDRHFHSYLEKKRGKF